MSFREIDAIHERVDDMKEGVSAPSCVRHISTWLFVIVGFTFEATARAPQSAKFGLPPDVAQTLCQEMADWRIRESAESRIARFRQQGIDVVPYLIEVLQRAPFKVEVKGNQFTLRRSTVRYHSAVTQDERAVEAIVADVRRRFPKRIRTSADDLCVTRMLTCLGTSRGDKALDLLLEISKRNYWEGRHAPIVDLERFAKHPPDQRKVENAQETIVFRRAALTAFAASGTERAVRYLGTGKEFPDDFPYSATDRGSCSDFAIAVMASCGYKDIPFVDTISAESMEKILAIYRRYGKEFVPYVRPPHWSEPCMTPYRPDPKEE